MAYYGYGPPQPPQPPGVDMNMLSGIFQRVDRDRSGFISAEELGQALGNGTWTPFNPDTVKLMISMFDTTHSGQINFNDFTALWKYVTEWQTCFRSYDRANTGSIDRYNLKAAMTAFGYRLSDRFYDILIQKFDRQGRGALVFDDFVQCAIVLQTLTNSFQGLDTNRCGQINIAYEHLLSIVFTLRNGVSWL